MQDIPDVLESAEFVMAHASAVRINRAALRAWTRSQDPARLPRPATPPELQYAGPAGAAANVCLLLDCLNFCFWSPRPWSVAFRGQTWTRTYAMYAGVLRAIERDATWLKAERWAAAEARDVAEMFAGEGEIPLAAERRAVLNETGRCLAEHFAGEFAEAVARADGQARRLAYLLAEFFPSFRDVAPYRGRTVAFLKRAQICASDLHHLWRRGGGAGLQGTEALTVFADYRLPQYLRQIGIIEVTPELAARIEREEELPAGEAEEVELRAATIVAAERMCQEWGGTVPACTLDYVLWLRSHDADVTLKHHRTRTVYY
jgi:hypothetical protein